MKFLILALAMLVPGVSCSQKRVKKVDIKEEGLLLNVAYKPVIDKVAVNGLDIKITPVSSENLDSMFSLSSFLDGKFSYAHYEKSIETYFLRKQRRKTEKTNYELLIEGLDWLSDNEKINEEEYEILLDLIVSDFFPEQKKEQISLMFTNPYFVGKSYLSVFRIEFNNPTSTAQVFDQQIFVKTMNNVTEALSTNFIANELSLTGDLSTQRTISLKRFNLETPLVVPANSLVIKYFAVIPVDHFSETVQVVVGLTKQLFTWNVEMSQVNLDKQHSYFEFNVENLVAGYELDGSSFSIIKKTTPRSAYLKDGKLFINSENLNDKFEIFSLTLAFDGLYYSRTKDITGNGHLDQAKMRRSVITLDSQKITDIKRKIK